MIPYSGRDVQKNRMTYLSPDIALVIKPVHATSCPLVGMHGKNFVLNTRPHHGEGWGSTRNEGCFFHADLLGGIHCPSADRRKPSIIRPAQFTRAAASSWRLPHTARPIRRLHPFTFLSNHCNGKIEISLNTRRAGKVPSSQWSAVKAR